MLGLMHVVSHACWVLSMLVVLNVTGTTFNILIGILKLKIF